MKNIHQILKEMGLAEYFDYKGNVYAVLDKVRMKCPMSGVWVDAVFYTDGKTKNVREKKDFDAKFTLMTNEAVKTYQ